jgi:hypothetical protein
MPPAIGIAEQAGHLPPRHACPLPCDATNPGGIISLSASLQGSETIFLEEQCERLKMLASGASPPHEVTANILGRPEWFVEEPPGCDERRSVRMSQNLAG